MARTHTAGERTASSSPHVRHFLWAEALREDGVWMDLATMASRSLLVGAEITDNRDQQTVAATIRIALQVSPTESTSPLRGDSVLNDNGAGAFAPIISAGTRMRLFCAAIGPTGAPVAGDKKEIWTGVIDRTNFTTDPVVLTGRDLGAYLIDTYITDKRSYGGSASPMGAKAIMQQIILDNAQKLPAGFPTTITAPWGDPTFVVNDVPYIPHRVSVFEAIHALALKFGWVVRFRYNAAGVSELMLFDPLRANVTPDLTVTPSEYKAVETAELNTIGVRNVIEAEYIDAATGAIAIARATSPASIVAFGERYALFAGDLLKGITNATDAQTFVDSVRDDLSIPPFDHTVRSTLTWMAEVGDVLQLTSNVVHYNAAQVLACFAVVHRFLDTGEAETLMLCRGRPAGAYMEWLKRLGRLTDLPAPFPRAVFRGPFPEHSYGGGVTGDGAHWIEIEFTDEATDFVDVWARSGLDNTVTIPDPNVAQASTRILRPDGAVGKVPNFRTRYMLATTPDLWKLVRARAGNYRGVNGLEWAPDARQTLDPVPGVVDGVLDPVVGLVVTEAPGHNLVSVNAAVLDPGGNNFILIARDGRVVEEIHVGTSTGTSFVFDDIGLDPAKKYTYWACVGTAVTDAAGDTFFVTGARLGWNTTSYNVPQPARPIFTHNTPTLVLSIFTGFDVLLKWSSGMSALGATTMTVESGPDPLSWPTVVGVSSGVDLGILTDTDASPKWYRLVAKDAGGVVLGFSLPVYWNGIGTPSSGGIVAPVFANGSPKVEIRGGAPVLVIYYTSATSGAAVVAIQKSVGGGPWVDVFVSANVLADVWTGGQVAEVADYRLVARDASGNDIATSPSGHWDGFVWT